MNLKSKFISVSLILQEHFPPFIKYVAPDLWLKLNMHDFLKNLCYAHLTQQQKLYPLANLPIHVTDLTIAEQSLASHTISILWSLSVMWKNTKLNATIFEPNVNAVICVLMMQTAD